MDYDSARIISDALPTFGREFGSEFAEISSQTVSNSLETVDRITTKIMFIGLLGLGVYCAYQYFEKSKFKAN